MLTDMENKLFNKGQLVSLNRDHNRWNKRHIHKKREFPRNKREKKGIPRLKCQEIFIQNAKHQDTT